VTIKGLRTRYSVKKFLEFLLVAESEKQLMMGESGLVTTGIFHIVDDSLTRFSEYCLDGVSNSNFRPKSEVSVLWTAPSILVASCITFKYDHRFSHFPTPDWSTGVFALCFVAGRQWWNDLGE